jgi:hypothetical protein
MTQKKITNRLLSLEELDGISVSVNGSTHGTIRIEHNKHHGPVFLFRWHTDHFVGYFIDRNDAQSQAVISLYTPMDAIRFVNAYATLNEIRANQKGS